MSDWAIRIKQPVAFQPRVRRATLSSPTSERLAIGGRHGQADAQRHGSGAAGGFSLPAAVSLTGKSE
jgi:hypothetical protein